MKKDLIIGGLVVVFAPIILSFLITGKGEKPDCNTIEVPENTTSQIIYEPLPTEEYTEKTVCLWVEDHIIEMKLEDYVAGVVLAEMPTYFEMEALKAQAVVARTFTCKRMEASKHEYGDICTNPGCCQAYIAPGDFLQKGGTQKELDKVRSAVQATSKMVLYYDGELIEATYFSCSGGRTEDAQAVWGADVPYLQSVESPGEEAATHYTDTYRFTGEEFQNKLQIRLEGYPGDWIGRITYTEGGGVAEIAIGDYVFSGTDIRQKLGLRSTAFVITPAGNSVLITTRGFGHRVGMSQYGADAMAMSGKTYGQILAHYYRGTELAALIG